MIRIITDWGICLMKSSKKIILTGIICSVLCFCGCSKSESSSKVNNSDEGKGDSNEIRTYTSYFAATGKPISENNVVQELIAEKIGARCIETFLSESKTADDEIGEMVISAEYPDFIYGGPAQQKLLDANALIPLNEYWDDYENVKNFFDDETWDKIRDKDGNIYYIPLFGNVYLYDSPTVHSGEAFWMQVKVLKWAGYPEIKTLDQYFDVLERYLEANPTDENGNKNIGYEILTDGYLYYCLENPPQFLDGYPNDGCCIVDPKTLTAMDYNTTDTAKRWFKKLNDEYHKGIIDPECFVLSTDQYRSKLEGGNVLGMVDQYWFFRPIEATLPDDSQYIPIGVVIDEGIEEQYRTNPVLDVSQGIGISVSCDDIEGALKFFNDLLDPEILTLRSWGIKDVDYLVDENGLFYRTDEQRKNGDDPDYAGRNLCSYAYLPAYVGMDHDGINAYVPQNQPSELYNKLPGMVKECFNAYNVQTYSGLLNTPKENSAWYPMWSYTNTFTPDTDYGKAKEDMDAIKHKYLPKVVMSEDFDAAWEEYMQVYNNEWDKDLYFNTITEEVRRRSK